MFDVDMTQFECNSLTCWMVFEDRHKPAALSWLNNATCEASSPLAGILIRYITPVQLHCIYIKYHE